ncbi:MAG: ribonuclease P protein component [Halothiobacillaceae bacterium]
MPVGALGLAGFGRDRRLLTPEDYRRVFSARQRVSQDGLALAWCESPAARSRLGLAIAKRQIRRAHERNRIKRIAREAFRARARKLPPVDLVLMAHTQVEQLDGRALRQALDELLDRVSIKFDRQVASPKS